MVAARQPGTDGTSLRTLAVCKDGLACENFDYEPAGTPCAPVLAGELCLCPRDARKVYTPCDQVSAHLLMESYVGAPILDSEGRVQGLLAVAHTAPLADAAEAASLLRIFSARAGAELERQRSTQRQLELERQVLHGQKRESLGVLAGGIAHDFNNLLAAMLGNLNLAQAELPATDPAQPNLETLEQLIHRATDLTGQMLAYSGKGHFIVRAVDLNLMLQEMTNLMAVAIPKNVSLQYLLAAPLPPIKADPAQLQQLVMNLLTNASDAIGDRPGTIQFHTEQVVADLGYLDQLAFGDKLRPGPYVTLAVKDTGCGIDPDALGRIFEPFFTTKAKGRGLGLAATLGILRGHQAGMMIQSQMGVGTTFRLLFPAWACAGPMDPVPSDPGRKPLPRALVLVVDDEEPVRNATRDMLKSLGMETLTAVDGQDGVEQVLQHPDLQLVLMDLTMPRMDGREAVLNLQRLRPALPVILVSGYNEQDSLKQSLSGGLAGFLKKPYSLETLRAMVGEALGQQPGYRPTP